MNTTPNRRRNNRSLTPSTAPGILSKCTDQDSNIRFSSSTAKTVKKEGAKNKTSKQKIEDRCQEIMDLVLESGVDDCQKAYLLESLREFQDKIENDFKEEIKISNEKKIIAHVFSSPTLINNIEASPIKFFNNKENLRLVARPVENYSPLSTIIQPKVDKNLFSQNQHFSNEFM